MKHVETARVTSDAWQNKLYITWKNEDGSCKEKLYYACSSSDPSNPIARIDIDDILGFDEEELYYYMMSI